ncbi:MAG: hypothetical protein JWQ06_1314 [Mucilaginibacter sp.]|nr:hypothetical protein [Mucilaginibacter sp.]
MIKYLFLKRQHVISRSEGEIVEATAHHIKQN